MEAHRVERKLSAIFAADVEGYSRLMGRDEVGTLRTLTAYRVIIDRLIASHRGRIFNTAGDSILADFASAVDAVQCAVEVQDAITKENSDRLVGEQMRFRIGIHPGPTNSQRRNRSRSNRVSGLRKPVGQVVGLAPIKQSFTLVPAR